MQRPEDVFAGPMGVVLMADLESRAALASRVVEDARSNDHLRTDFPVLDIRRLGPDVAQFTGVAVRINREGMETRRFGFIYTMRFDGEDWKLVVLGHV